MLEIRRLESGARLIIEEIPHLRSAAMGIFVGVGSRHESDDLSGAAHFIEHMLFKGTQKYSAREIAELFEGIGGQLNAYTAKEYTCYYARCLDENLDLAMDILFDMVLGSVFGEKELDTERGVILEEINMYEDTPDELIHDAFAQVLWAGQPIGRPILGTSETVGSISRGAIVDHYRRTYVPGNMIISIAGNVQSERVAEAVERHLGNGWLPHAPHCLDKPAATRGIKLIAKDTEQLQLCLGQESVSYHDEERFAQNVLNNILGGGISSRLFQSIREERGLAYSVYSYPSMFSDTGSFSIYAGINPQKTADFFTALYDEIDRFLAHGVTQDEIIRTQKLIKANTLLGLESVMTRMNRLGKTVLYYDRIVEIDEVIEQVYAVTPEKVREYAQRVVNPSRFSLAAIGPADALEAVRAEFEKR